MKDLSPDTDQLLARARGASALPPERRALIKSRLLAQIAAGGAIATTTTVTASSKAAWLFGPVAKGVALVAVMSSVGTGAYFAWHAREMSAHRQASAAGAAAFTESAPSNAPATVTNPAANGNSNGSANANANPNAETPSPAAGETTKEPAAGEVAKAPETPAPGHAVRTQTATAAAPTKTVASSAAHEAPPAAASAAVSPDSLAEETNLIRQADQALRAGNASAALGLLDQHAARFPRGVLSNERNGERMVARCQLGQVSASALSTYLAAHPQSALSARIRDACSSVH